jgi:hypothetical protein
MRLRINDTRKGLHPSEAIVQIDTATGPVEIVVGQQAIRSGSIEIGSPVGEHENFVLVELPAETSNGSWRVWVPRNSILGEALEAAE